MGNNKITVHTDHSALAHLSTKNLSDIENPRLVRLLEKILHFNYVCKYVKGEDNKVADCLSRYQMDELEEDKPGMCDVPRNYEAKHQIMKISTRSTKLSVPLDIQHIAEKGQSSSSYQKAIRFIRGEMQEADDPDLEEIRHKKQELSVEDTDKGQIIFIHN